MNTSLLLFKIILLALLVSVGESKDVVKIIPADLTEVPIHFEDDTNIILLCEHPNNFRLQNYTWKTPERTFENVMEEHTNGMSVVLQKTKFSYEYQLRIERFSQDTEGEYACWIQSNAARWFEEKKFILKRMIPQNVTIFGIKEDRLSCPYTRGESIEWFRNGEIISRRKNPKHLVEFSYSSVIFKKPQISDSGLYDCRIITEKGNFIVGLYQLNVIRHEDADEWGIKPKRSPDSHPYYGSMSFKEGFGTDITCTCLDCWPLTSFMWVTPFGNFSHPEDENLPEGFSLTVSMEELRYLGEFFKLNLNIKSLWRKHEGNYTCILENSLGVVKYNQALKVTPNVFNAVRAVAFEGYKFKLYSNISDSYTYWTADKKHGDSHQISLFQTYKIFPVMKNDTGLYIAKASIMSGYNYKTIIRKTYDLKILSSTEEQPMKVNRVQEGGKIRLACGGNESINRTWTHNARLIEYPNYCPSTRILSLRPVINQTLTVDGKFSNSGLYRCSFTGPQGISYKMKFLILVKPKTPPKLQPEIPSFKTINTTIKHQEEKLLVTVKRDFLLCEDFLTLQCRCKKACQPLLRYNWTIPESCQNTFEELKEDPEDEDGFIYSLKLPVNPKCEGLFSCNVENSEGATNLHFLLDNKFKDLKDKLRNTCCPNKYEKDSREFPRNYPEISCGGW